MTPCKNKPDTVLYIDTVLHIATRIKQLLMHVAQGCSKYLARNKVTCNPNAQSATESGTKCGTFIKLADSHYDRCVALMKVHQVHRLCSS